MYKCAMRNATLQTQQSDQSPPSKTILFPIKSVSELMTAFPTTRYYGSKRKLLPWIYDNLKLLDFKTVLDPFGGSGSVSQLFRAMNKDVTYHDAFRFNGDIASSVLTNSWTLTLSDLEQFLGRVRPQDSIVSRYFDGIFFTSDENRWIDGFMEELGRTDNAPNRSLLKHLLYQACLKKRPFNLFHRANLGVRTNTLITRSFGNATTWERSFGEHILQEYREISKLRDIELPSATIIPSGDALQVPTGYDLVYLDPPYVSTKDRVNRDNYWLRYHFLEGLSDYENWAAKIDLDSRIRQTPQPDYFTSWSRRHSFKEQLFGLVDRHKSSIVVLSYVKAAYPDDQEIREFFESTFSRVSVHSTEHSHALSASRKRELLFIGIPA